MKTRLIGSIFVAAVLIVLFVLTEGSPQSQPLSQPIQSTNDNSFKDLKIN